MAQHEAAQSPHDGTAMTPLARKVDDLEREWHYLDGWKAGALGEEQQAGESAPFLRGYQEGMAWQEHAAGAEQRRKIQAEARVEAFRQAAAVARDLAPLGWTEDVDNIAGRVQTAIATELMALADAERADAERPDALPTENRGDLHSALGVLKAPLRVLAGQRIPDQGIWGRTLRAGAPPFHATLLAHAKKKWYGNADGKDVNAASAVEVCRVLNLSVPSDEDLQWVSGTEAVEAPFTPEEIRRLRALLSRS